jgi:LAO/AO transport system kinase
VWETVESYRAAMQAAGAWAERRRTQAHAWMWNEITETLVQALRDDPRMTALLPDLEAEVARGALAPGAGARRLVATFRGTP